MNKAHLFAKPYTQRNGKVFTRCGRWVDAYDTARLFISCKPCIRKANGELRSMRVVRPSSDSPSPHGLYVGQLNEEEAEDVDRPTISEREARKQTNAAVYAILVGIGWEANTAGKHADKYFPLYRPSPPKMKTVPRTFTRSDGRIFKYEGNRWHSFAPDVMQGWIPLGYTPDFSTVEDAEGLASLMRRPNEEVPE